MRFQICRKVSAIAYAAALFTISTLGTQAQPSISLPTQSKIQVTKEIVSAPSDEDKDWKITKVETRSVFDETTKQTVILQTVYREGPPGYKSMSANRSCDNVIQPAFPNLVTATCTYLVPVSKTEGAGGSGITALVVHYLDKYVSSSGAYLYQPTKLEISWTRTDSSYNFSSYRTEWGCGLCTKCDTSNTTTTLDITTTL